MSKGLNEYNLLHLCDKVPIEKIHTSFCRYILYVNKKATNNAVRAELGRRPLFTNLTVHSFKYWLDICNDGNKKTLLNKAYLESYNDAYLHSNHVWALYMHKYCDILGLSEVWFNQGTRTKCKQARIFKQSLLELYDCNWWNDMCRDDAKLRTYKEFKNSIEMGKYLLTVQNPMTRKEFTKLRISAHQLQIELGRYTVPRMTPVEERVCKTCGVLEDERHFILTCPVYSDARIELFDSLQSFTTLQSLNTEDRFAFIMSYGWGDTEVLTHVINFVNKAEAIRKAHLIPKSSGK